MGFFKWIAFTYCKHTIALYLFLSVVLSSDLMVVFVYYRHYVWFPGPCYLICVLLWQDYLYRGRQKHCRLVRGTTTANSYLALWWE